MKDASNLSVVCHKNPQTGTSLEVQWLAFCASSARSGDATQPSHLLLPPSPPALSPSQHQSLFQ